MCQLNVLIYSGLQMNPTNVLGAFKLAVNLKISFH